MLNLYNLASIDLNHSKRVKSSPLIPNRSHSKFVSQHSRSLGSLFRLHMGDLSLKFLIHKILAIEVFDVCKEKFKKKNITVMLAESFMRCFNRMLHVIKLSNNEEVFLCFFLFSSFVLKLLNYLVYFKLIS